MNLKKGLSLFAILIVIFSLFFIIKFVGFVINTPSSVTIELPITVKADSFNGIATDFSNMTNSQLRNITGMVLEKTEYGKIVFQESIDLAQNNKNWVVDLDSNVNISNNSIEINTDELSGLERPAVLYLYNLNFSNPQIMRNGAVCPDSVCQKISYSSGILTFSVNSFTSYSAEETPPSNNGGAGGGGGGGGGKITENASPVANPDFAPDKTLIKVQLKQGETQRETLEIMNTGDNIEDFTINYTELKKFIVISEDSFTLAKGKAKTLTLDFFAKDDEIPDAYVGRITVQSGNIKKVVNVIVEIKAKKPLFDIKTEVLNKEIFEGDKVNANISVINMGDISKMDINLYYALKSFDGKTLPFKEESIFINDKLSLTRELETYKGILPDDYIFYSRVSYENISAVSVDTFKVKQPLTKYLESLKWFNTALILLLIILVLLIIRVIYKKLTILSFLKAKEKLETKRPSSKFIEKDIERRIKRIKRKLGKKI